MNQVDSSHQQWLTEVARLRTSLSELSHTNPDNLYQHFFLLVVKHEFSLESETRKLLLNRIICQAVSKRDISGTVRQRAGQCFKMSINIPILQQIRLADIRNVVVFVIFKHCGHTIDTYFDRYSSPPGSVEENECYSAIAHGNAIASAEKVECIETILMSLQVLKRFYNIVDYIQDVNLELTPVNLNWICNMWMEHIKITGLSDLIWTLFLDIFCYENAIHF